MMTCFSVLRLSLMIIAQTQEECQCSPVGKVQLYYPERQIIPLMLFLTHTHDNRVKMYLDSHQHLVLGWAEVVTLCQEDFAKCSFTQLPFQDDVSPLYMLDH